MEAAGRHRLVALQEGAWPCCSRLCSGTHSKGAQQQSERRGTEGHIASQLPLGKESAWAEGWREATPAAASEVPLPCPQMILGEAVKGHIPMLSPSSDPAPQPLCPDRTLHCALPTQPSPSSPWAAGHSPTGPSRFEAVTPHGAASNWRWSSREGLGTAVSLGREHRPLPCPDKARQHHLTGDNHHGKALILFFHASRFPHIMQALTQLIAVLGTPGKPHPTVPWHGCWMHPCCHHCHGFEPPPCHPPAPQGAIAQLLPVEKNKSQSGGYAVGEGEQNGFSCHNPL